MKLLNGDSIPIAIVVYSSISFKWHSICNIWIYIQYNVIIYTIDHSWIDYDTTIILINTTNKWPQRHTNTPRLPLQCHPQYHPTPPDTTPVTASTNLSIWVSTWTDPRVSSPSSPTPKRDRWGHILRLPYLRSNTCRCRCQNRIAETRRWFLL